MKIFRHVIGAAFLFAISAPAFAQMGGIVLPTNGRYLNTQYITATGACTYTPTAGTTSIEIELQAGGGGGAGVAQAGVGTASIGLGGNGGGWLTKRITANFSGASCVIGAKGSGGAAGANDGTAGSDTTFTTTGGSPVTYTAKGGTGGIRLGPFSPPFQFNQQAVVATTGGDLNRSGGSGGLGITLSTGNGNGGLGGDSMYSPGAPAPNGITGLNTHGNGVNADGNGGGGSGGVTEGVTGGNASGGDGSNGVIIIREYS